MGAVGSGGGTGWLATSVRAVTVPAVAVIDAVCADVSVVVAVPFGPVTTEASESVPTSVANRTVTPGSTSR